MLTLLEHNDSIGLIVAVEFASGKHHVGATGTYLQDQTAVHAAFASLQEYLAWGRAHLETM